MVPELHHCLDQIIAICRRHGVAHLWLFGSATGRGKRPFRSASSDVDMVVDFIRTPGRPLVDQYLGLLEDLETLLKRPVQLLTERSIKNPYLRSEIEENKELVYAATSEKALV